MCTKSDAHTSSCIINWFLLLYAIVQQVNFLGEIHSFHSIIIYPVVQVIKILVIGISFVTSLFSSFLFSFLYVFWLNVSITSCLMIDGWPLSVMLAFLVLGHQLVVSCAILAIDG
ncbi:unnamed protein product [Ilex paraguariensis]|uniref:Uncharacterized protein n=1 Tax=Ilex paraguariensis TaxID=185542 RepID=A0ABC8SAE1_9AQUA